MHGVSLNLPTGYSFTIVFGPARVRWPVATACNCRCKVPMTQCCQYVITRMPELKCSIDYILRVSDMSKTNWIVLIVLLSRLQLSMSRLQLVLKRPRAQCRVIYNKQWEHCFLTMLLSKNQNVTGQVTAYTPEAQCHENKCIEVLWCVDLNFLLNLISTESLNIQVNL